MKNHDLSYSKANFITLKKERDMLKITLKCITEENENLKNELNDMKITAKKNKDMLKEYVDQITNKDKLFEKMSSTIEQLKNRLKVLEQSKREKAKELKRYDLKILNTNGNIRLGDYTQSIPNNHSTTTTSNNFTMNNIMSSCGGESMNNGFNILNNNINRLGKGKHGLNTVNNAKLNKSMSNFNDINKNFNILNNSNKNNVNTNNYKNSDNIVSDENKNKIKNNDDNNNQNLNIKSLAEKQSYIMEEILNIKDDIQFIMENKNKSKLRDKLNQSLVYSDSLNSSFYSERNNNEQNKNQNQNMNTSFSSENNQEKPIDNSYISQNISNLSVSYYGTDQNILRHLNYTMNTTNVNGNYNSESNHKISKKRKNYNLKERYVIDENFSNFIDKTNIKKEILFLIDGKENVWEIIKRGDLSSSQLRKYGKEKENKIKSILSLIKGDNNQNIMELISGNNKDIDKKDADFFYTDLIDIEIKDPTDNIFK